MKYETLSEMKSGANGSGVSLTYTFTFTNNIDHIVELKLIDCTRYDSVNAGLKLNYFKIDSYTIADNVLTVVVTGLATTTAYYEFLLATVASY